MYSLRKYAVQRTLIDRKRSETVRTIPSAGSRYIKDSAAQSENSGKKAAADSVLLQNKIKNLSSEAGGAYENALYPIDILICFQKIGRENKQYDQMLSGYENKLINDILNDIERHRREEKEREKQRSREKRKEQWRSGRKARGATIRIVLMIASLIWLAYVTYSTLQYTKSMNYWGNFEDWVENAGIRLAVSLGIVGIACGVNYHKGFKVDYHIGAWIGAYVMYALFYTVLWIKYTSDWTAIIAFPIIFFGLFGCIFLISWVNSKLFK